MVYQTEMTRAILAQIEKKSLVRWNDGSAPSNWYINPDENSMLSIFDTIPMGNMHNIFSYTDRVPMGNMCILRPRHLFLGKECDDTMICISCTEEEFVAHCQRLFPQD